MRFTPSNGRSPRSALRSYVTLAFTLMPGIVLAAQGDCVQPVSTGASSTVRDCLYLLQVGVGGGSPTCDTPCICDADGDRAVSATDALLCMRKAVEIDDFGLCSLCAQPMPTS